MTHADVLAIQEIFEPQFLALREQIQDSKALIQDLKTLMEREAHTRDAVFERLRNDIADLYEKNRCQSDRIGELGRQLTEVKTQVSEHKQIHADAGEGDRGRKANLVATIGVVVVGALWIADKVIELVSKVKP